MCCTAISLIAVMGFSHAAGARSSLGGLLVSPAKITASVKPGDVLPPIRVKNTTNEHMVLTAYVGRGEHRLDGSPIYYDSPNERQWGAKHLKLKETELTLAPFEQGIIQAEVAESTAAEGGVYPVIFLEMTANDTKTIGGISRVAVITLLEIASSKPHKAQLAVETVQIEQIAPGAPVDVYALVSNYGHTHAAVYGHIEVKHDEKDVAARLPVDAMTVLPGLSRRIKLGWHPPELPVGTYDVTAKLFSGDTPVKGDKWAFQVSKPYALATLRGDLVSLVPTQTEALVSSDFRAVVHNSGTMPWQASGKLEVVGMDGLPKTQIVLATEEVAPGTSREIDGILPPLPPGRYKMRMHLASDGGRLIEAEQALDVRGRDTLAQIRQ